jgi:hypothetical protein
MKSCIQAEMDGEQQKALQLLSEATLEWQSRMAWDPTNNDWQATDLWRLRLEIYDDARMQAYLKGRNPQRWAQILHFYKQYRPQWSTQTVQLLRQRKNDLVDHNDMMRQILRLSESDPAKAEKYFNKWSQRESLEIYWHPYDRRWITANDLREQLSSKN